MVVTSSQVNEKQTGQTHVPSAYFTGMKDVCNSEQARSKVNVEDGSTSSVVEPPDGGWAWVIAATVCMANLLNNGHFKSFGLYVAPLMQAMDASPSQVAWISSIWIGCSNCFGIVASVLTQVLGPRIVVVIGAVVVCSGLAASSFVRSLPLLYFTFGACCGIGMSFTFSPSLQMIGQYFLKRRGIANGICMGGNALGGIAIPLVVASLLDEYGFRGTVLVMGGLMFNTSVCAMLWHPIEWHLPKKRMKQMMPRCGSSPMSSSRTRDVTSNIGTEMQNNSRTITVPIDLIRYEQRNSVQSDAQTCTESRCSCYREQTGNTVTGSACNDQKLDTKWTKSQGKLTRTKLVDISLWREPMYWIIAVNQICSLVAYPSTQLFLPLRVLQLGYNREDGALLLSTLAVMDLAGRLFISWLSDFGLCSRGYWFSAGMTISGLVAMLLPEFHNLSGLTAAVAAFGFCSGAHVGLFPSRISDAFGGHRVAMVAALVNLCTCPFSFTGSPFMGWIMETTQSYRACQIVAGSILVFGGLLCLVEPLVHRREERMYVINV